MIIVMSMDGIKKVNEKKRPRHFLTGRFLVYCGEDIMTKFQGILLTLKKRMRSIREADGNHYKYVVFGFYDGLDINVVDHWYELRPKGLQQRDLQVNLKTPFIDQYTIRAFMPQNRDELQSQGFAYDFWENIGRSANNLQTDRGIDSNCAYITMSVINMDKTYVSKQDNFMTMQENVITILKESIQKAGYAISELNCAIFPSIGYSDFVILFFTDKLKKSLDVVDYMREKVGEGEKTQISNCYSVCGIDKSSLTCVKPDKDTKITIRMNLREGISSKSFIGALKKEIDSRLEKEPEAKELIDLNTSLNSNFYMTCGNSDCLILPEQPLGYFAKLHAPNHLFNPGDDFFKNYIAILKTSVRILENNDNNVKSSRESYCQKLQQYEERFKKFIHEVYEPFLDENNMHSRSSKALQQVMKNFLNVAQTGHAFDIEHIVGKAFLSFLDTMEYFIQKTADVVSDKISTGDRERAELENEILLSKKKLAVDALYLFKDYIGDFVSDLARSDRSCIEGNAMIHPSIGSATKLLFAYNRILEKVAETLNKNDKFTFVVISGGCDYTEAIDLFSFAGIDEDIKKTIIIKLPEMSIYDIQGTLFRMLHECMHFIGDRKRKERCLHIFHALAYAVAWDICELEFHKEKIQKLKEHATLLLDNKEEFGKAFECKCNDLREDVEKDIAQLILNQKLFTDYLENSGDEAFYTETLENDVLSLESIVDIFCVEGKDEEGEDKEVLQDCLYDILCRADEGINKIICQNLKCIYDRYCETDENEAMKVQLTLNSFQWKQQGYEFRKAYPKEKDLVLKNFIMDYANSFVGNFSLMDHLKDTISGFKYLDLLHAILFAMVESFADCSGIRKLNMKKEDFLLMFIYEVWDVEEAFSKTTENLFRLGADMAVSYDIRGKLDDKTKRDVRDKVERRNEQGYQYRNVSEMLERVDDLLEEYNRSTYKKVCNEIEAYLKACLNGAESWEWLEELYTLSDFQNAEQIYAVLDKVMILWKDLGKRC